MGKIERIAILGANSLIAIDYIELVLKKTERFLYLFTRNPLGMSGLLDDGCASKFKFLGYEDFGKERYDLIINFVGGSDPALINKLGKEIFVITQQYDDLAIQYLQKNTTCKYIFISSGAAYGNVFAYEPATNITKSNFDFDNLPAFDYYGAAKYLSEQRHRTFLNLHIVDVRVFSYFSKRQSLNSKLFLPQLIGAIKNGAVFSTLNEEMWRDYIGPIDFFNFLECMLSQDGINDSFDCFTRAPVSKLALLKKLADEYGLRLSLLMPDERKINPKTWYYSVNRRAESLGYFPEFNSINTILNGIKGLI